MRKSDKSALWKWIPLLFLVILFHFSNDGMGTLSILEHYLSPSQTSKKKKKRKVYVGLSSLIWRERVYGVVTWRPRGLCSTTLYQIYLQPQKWGQNTLFSQVI